MKKIKILFLSYSLSLIASCDTNVNNNNLLISDSKLDNKLNFSIKNNPNTYYKIVNRSSGKCLEVDNNNIYNNGAKIQQWDCNGEDNQQWSLVGQGQNGIHKIFNKKSGKLIDLNDGGKNNGEKIHQYNNTNQSWQNWLLNSSTGSLSNVVIYNNLTKKVIDVPSSKINQNGAYVQQWDYNSLTSQSWKIEQINVISQPTPVPINQAPKSALDNTNNGANIKDIFTQTGWASDDKKISRVEVYVNGSYIGNAEYGSYRGDLGNNTGFKVNIDTKKYASGSLSIKIITYDDNNLSSSVSRTVNINNIPIGNIDSPKDKNVTGNVLVEGWRADDGYIANTVFYISNHDGSDTKPLNVNNLKYKYRKDVNDHISQIYPNWVNPSGPAFDFTFDSNLYTNGNKKISMYAYDNNGAFNIFTKDIFINNQKTKYSIIFVNGIKTTYEGYQKNLESLKTFISKNYSGQDIEVKGVYNKTEWGGFGDILESGRQIKAQKDGVSYVSIFSRNEVDVIRDIKNEIETAKNNLRKVIFIPHSQGNFFVNKAVQEVYSTRGMMYNNLIGILGLGSPSRVFNNSIPQTYFIQNKYDMVSWIAGYQDVSIDYKDNNETCQKVFGLTGIIKTRKKVLDVENYLSGLTVNSGISLQSSPTNNNIFIDQRLPFYKNGIEVANTEAVPFNTQNMYISCGQSVSEGILAQAVGLPPGIVAPTTPGFFTYHPLETGYLNPQKSSSKIKETLDKIMINLK